MRTLRRPWLFFGAVSLLALTAACSGNLAGRNDNANTQASTVAETPDAIAEAAVITTGQIALKAAANNLYVSTGGTSNGLLKPNATATGATEKFAIQTNADGTVSLKSLANNLFVSIDNTAGGPLMANRPSVDTWEKFQLVSNTDGTVSFKSIITNGYVCAENGGASTLIANRGAIAGWEKFTTVAITGPVTTKSAKRGVAYDLRTAPDLSALKSGVSWWYNWGVGTSAPGGFTSSYGMDYVPMSWNGNNIANNGAVEAYLVAHPECKYLLVINEPNLADQANKTIAEVVTLWPQIEAIAQRHGVKIVGPALNWGTVNTVANPADPIAWLDGFFSQYRTKYSREPQVDAIAIHWYDYGLVGSGTGFLDSPTKLPKYGKKIWVTEFSNWHVGDGTAAIDTVAKQKEQMRQWVSWMETHAIVERYAWFTGRQPGNPHYISLFQNYGLGSAQGDGVLSELGQYYVSLPVGQ